MDCSEDCTFETPWQHCPRCGAPITWEQPDPGCDTCGLILGECD